VYMGKILLYEDADLNRHEGDRNRVTVGEM
jgi:hypothetical protein